tara:strand:- start:608 stop:844 length:237 start_codon:yes stop_codon:yes gene_type:complete
MRLTNKNTGNSFNLSPKETAYFFYAKNGKGEFINDKDNYILKDTCREVSTLRFFLGCTIMILLFFVSVYLFFYLNYTI